MLTFLVTVMLGVSTQINAQDYNYMLYRVDLEAAPVSRGIEIAVEGEQKISMEGYIRWENIVVRTGNVPFLTLEELREYGKNKYCVSDAMKGSRRFFARDQLHWGERIVLFEKGSPRVHKVLLTYSTKGSGFGSIESIMCP